jgi:hypothetical protein
MMSHLIQFLQQHADEIISAAIRSLERSQLVHPQATYLPETQRRLRDLYHFLVESLAGRDLSVLVGYVETMAQTCFVAGFELHDLQVIFNVLEEALWKQIAPQLAPAEVVEALGEVSTVLGVGKDTMATIYVTLAARAKEPTLDVAELFKGT